MKAQHCFAEVKRESKTMATDLELLLHSLFA